MKATIMLTGEAKQNAYEMYLRMHALYVAWNTQKESTGAKTE